jgi:hypothetical protein
MRGHFREVWKSLKLKTLSNYSLVTSDEGRLQVVSEP